MSDCVHIHLFPSTLASYWSWNYLRLTGSQSHLISLFSFLFILSLILTIKSIVYHIFFLMFYISSFNWYCCCCRYILLDNRIWNYLISLYLHNILIFHAADLNILKFCFSFFYILMACLVIVNMIFCYVLIFRSFCHSIIFWYSVRICLIFWPFIYFPLIFCSSVYLHLMFWHSLNQSLLYLVIYVILMFYFYSEHSFVFLSAVFSCTDKFFLNMLINYLSFINLSLIFCETILNIMIIHFSDSNIPVCLVFYFLTFGLSYINIRISCIIFINILIVFVLFFLNILIFHYILVSLVFHLFFNSLIF